MISFLALLLLPVIASYRVAIFAPDVTESQHVWNARVAKTLAKAGHDVTIFIVYSFESPPPRTKFAKGFVVEHVNSSIGRRVADIVEGSVEVTFKDLPLWDHRHVDRFKIFEEMSNSCQHLISNSTFLEKVKAGKFDIAFTHMYVYCNIGIVHYAGIPSWVWLNSAPMTDHVAAAIGMPAPPSYCTPLFQGAGDNLTFVERLKSFVGHAILPPMTKWRLADRETAFFRAIIDPNFPDLHELSKKCPLVMKKTSLVEVNSNELYDFGRPTLHKVVNIGGIGIPMDRKSVLPADYEKLVKESESHIVFTFGSVAPAYLMPDEWKKSLREVFSRHPKTRFFMRYEKDDDWTASLPSNVHATRWLPQTDLLLHAKCRGLMTHAGYNSLQDAFHAGVPLLTIALFGDQPRNSHLAMKLGVGVNVLKGEVGQPDVLDAAISKLLHDETLRSSSRRLRSMIASRPVAAEQLLVKWTELAAEFKTLDILVPFGVHLDFFTYYSLDVIAFFAVVICVFLFLATKIVCVTICFVWRCFARTNVKVKQN